MRPSASVPRSTIGSPLTDWRLQKLHLQRCLQCSRETSGPVKLVPDRGTHLWEQLRLEPGIALLPAETTPRRMRGREDGRSETLEGADTDRKSTRLNSSH